MAGRKPKLTKDLIKRIYQLISAGNYDITVFEYLNISSSAYYEWLKKGEESIIDGKTNLYVELVETVKKAKAEAEIRNVAIIQKAGEKSWQACAWWLERKAADRWRQQQKIEVEGLQFKILLPDDIVADDEDDE